MSREFTHFIADLEIASLRVHRPDDFVFLCGGPINDGSHSPLSRYLSLRDFVYRRLQAKIRPRLVLAESATQLFALSGYRDLVEFEVDIAHISSLVALISETPGSLAELGAFSVTPAIAAALYVIVEESLHGHNASFIRLGPFLALENLGRGAHDRVGDFSWKTRHDKSIIISSVHDQGDAIAASINERYVSETERIDLQKPSHLMIVIYWITYMVRGGRAVEILFYLRLFGVELNHQQLKRYLYAMRVAGWIGEKNVGSVYYYPRIDKDPFDYAFRMGVNDKSNSRRKVAVAQEIQKSPHKRPASVTALLGVP